MQFMNILSFDLQSPEIPICIIIQILQQQILCGRFKMHNVFLIFFSEQESVFECNYEPNSTEDPLLCGWLYTTHMLNTMGFNLSIK